MSDDTELCRFCFDGPDINNPLVNPCKCIGSMKYVHVQCIKKWRENTTNLEWYDKCQLCLTDFEVFLRWQKEDLPRSIALLKSLTQRPLAVTSILIYLHTTLLSFIPIILPLTASITEITAATPMSEIMEIRKSSYLTLQELYFTKISYLIYLGILVSTTCIYAIVYYNSFWKHIKNKKLYIYLWSGCVSDKGIFHSPLMTILITLLAAVVTFPFMSPTIFIYIYMLSCIYESHLSIINHMNIAAEIF